MAKRRTAAEQERIKADVRQAMINPPPARELVPMLLSCGHQEKVPSGLDATKAICSQCNAASMQSKMG